MEKRLEEAKKEVTATLPFADLIGSSEYANILGLDKYDEYINIFQATVKNIFLSETGKIDNKDFYIKGDEGCLIVYNSLSTENESEKNNIIEEEVDLAIKIAFRIKHEWFLKELNIDRIKSDKKPYEVGIGINTGKVTIAKHVSTPENKKVNAEGYAINLAKRIESESRGGIFTGIYLSEHAYNIYYQSSGEDTICFEEVSATQLKGITQKINIYEISSAVLGEINPILEISDNILDDKLIDIKIEALRKTFEGSHNTTIGLLLCNYYLNDKEYRKAEDIAIEFIRIHSQLPIWKLLLAQVYIDTIDNGGISEEDKVFLQRRAKELFENVIKFMPEHVEALLDLGTLYIDEGMKGDDAKEKEKLSDSALYNINIALRNDNDYSLLHYYKAAAIMLQYDMTNEQPRDAALECLKKAININSKIKDQINKDVNTYFKDLKEDNRLVEILKVK